MRRLVLLASCATTAPNPTPQPTGTGALATAIWEQLIPRYVADIKGERENSLAADRW